MKKRYKIEQGSTENDLFKGLRQKHAGFRPYFHVTVFDKSPVTFWPLITKIQGLPESNHEWRVSIAFEIKPTEQTLFKYFPKKYGVGS